MDSMLRTYYLTTESAREAMDGLNDRAKALQNKGESAGAVNTAELAALIIGALIVASVGYLAIKAFVTSLTDDLNTTPRPGQGGQ